MQEKAVKGNGWGVDFVSFATRALHPHVAVGAAKHAELTRRPLTKIPCNLAGTRYTDAIDVHLHRTR